MLRALAHDHGAHKAVTARRRVQRGDGRGRGVRMGGWGESDKLNETLEVFELVVAEGAALLGPGVAIELNREVQEGDQEALDADREML